MFLVVRKDITMKKNKKIESEIEASYDVLVLIGALTLVLVIILLCFGFLGLICWGVVNGILFLIGLPTTFTYMQGFVMGLVIKGLQIMIRQIISNSKKG